MHLSHIATITNAFEVATNAQRLLDSTDVKPSQLFTKIEAMTLNSAVILVQPEAQSFSGKCFCCQQQGHRSQECPNKKLTLLPEETPDDEEIEAE